jgi:hypothetical protein
VLIAPPDEWRRPSCELVAGYGAAVGSGEQTTFVQVIEVSTDRVGGYVEGSCQLTDGHLAATPHELQEIGPPPGWQGYIWCAAQLHRSPPLRSITHYPAQSGVDEGPR